MPKAKKRAVILNAVKNLSICCTLLLTSCYTLPQQHDYDNSRIYNMSFNKTWTAAVEYFAKYNVPIKTIEKDSGIIFAESEFYTNKEADCGKMGREHINNALGAKQFNLFIKSVGKNKTKVLVNMKLTDALVPDPISGDYIRIQCNSKGTLEEDILDYIGDPKREVIFKLK